MALDRSRPRWYLCLRRECHRRVVFNPQSAAYYCSTRCRVAAAREQAAIRVRLWEVDTLLASVTARSGSGRELAQERRALLWELSHYLPVRAEAEPLT